MATMIPHWLPQDVVPGERIVFERLKDDPIAQDWIVLHSYTLSRHLRQERGEIDFVVIAPSLGVMVVEVKSHLTVSFDGLWHLGQDEPTNIGPIKQAEGNMYSLKRIITESGRDIPAIDFCVIFPRAQFSQSSPEWHDWQVIDRSKGESRGFAACIRAALLGHLANVNKSQDDMKLNFPLKKAQLLANFLRPQFEVIESLASRNIVLNEEYRMILQEQFEALDQLENNSVLLFEGAAGTGKTLLALETARRSLLSGQRVLMLCFNRQLAKYLDAELGSQPNLIYCGTVASFMAQVAGIRHEPESINFSRLADDAMNVLAGNSNHVPAFDVLVVDEVQDIASTESMDFLELLIHSVENPDLRFFGDFEFQKLYFPQSDIRTNFLNRFPKVSTFKLWSNCRNRPGFENLISSLCDFSGLYLRFRLNWAGEVFKYLPYDNERDRVKSVESALEDLLKTYVPGEIVLLGNSEFESLDKFSQSMKGRFYEDDSLTSGRSKILNTTIRKFKGLEAKAVIIHDFSLEMDSELLYAGITRAIEYLVLVGPASENLNVAMKLLPKN